MWATKTDTCKVLMGAREKQLHGNAIGARDIVLCGSIMGAKEKDIVFGVTRG